MKHLLPATVLLLAITVIISALMASMGMASPHSFASAGETDSPQGAAFFLENATQYGFAHGEEPGRILGVSRDTAQTTITYWTHSAEGRRDGTMTGVLKGGVFEGNYVLVGKNHTSKGQITLLFRRDGTAEGTWNHGEGTSSIFWPDAPL